MVLFTPSADDKSTAFIKNMLTRPASIQYSCFFNSGNYQPNCRWPCAAGIVGADIANDRALCGLFILLANVGNLHGMTLLSRDHIAKIKVSMVTMEDATLLTPTWFALGFMKSMSIHHRCSDELETAIIEEKALGHHDAAVSIGFKTLNVVSCLVIP